MIGLMQEIGSALFIQPYSAPVMLAISVFIYTQNFQISCNSTPLSKNI